VRRISLSPQPRENIGGGFFLGCGGGGVFFFSWGVVLELPLRQALEQASAAEKAFVVPRERNCSPVESFDLPLLSLRSPSGKNLNSFSYRFVLVRIPIHIAQLGLQDPPDFEEVPLPPASNARSPFIELLFRDFSGRISFSPPPKSPWRLPFSIVIGFCGNRWEIPSCTSRRSFFSFLYTYLPPGTPLSPPVGMVGP